MFHSITYARQHLFALDSVCASLRSIRGKQQRAIASAAILVVSALTGVSINTQADASQIQPRAAQTVSQTRRAIDEKSAINAVWQLRQVQQKVQKIKRLSNGKARVGLRVDSSPTKAEPYYVIQLFEERPDRITTLDWFHVSTQGAVTVLDAITGDYISPAKWKIN